MSEASTAAEALRKDSVILKCGHSCAAEITSLVSPHELEPEKPDTAVTSSLSKWNKARTLIRDKHAGHDLALSDVGGCLLCAPATSSDGTAQGVLQVWS